MSTVDNMIGAGGATPPAAVKVWDPFVRVFHWSLAALFLAAFLTGEDAGQVHAHGRRLRHRRADGIAHRLGLRRSPPRAVQQLRPVAAGGPRLSARRGPAQGATVSRPQSGRRCHDHRASVHAARNRPHRLHDDNRQLLGCEGVWTYSPKARLGPCGNSSPSIPSVHADTTSATAVQ